MQKKNKKITVTVTETLLRNIEILTVDEDEALAMVQDMYTNEDFVLDSSDHSDTSFCIEKTVESEKSSSDYVAIIRDFRETEVLLQADNYDDALLKAKKMYAAGEIEFGDEAYDGATIEIR